MKWKIANTTSEDYYYHKCFSCKRNNNAKKLENYEFNGGEHVLTEFSYW